MSDDRTINAKNCTIYVGSVRIVLEPRPNDDDDDDDDGKIADGVAETRGRATDEDQDVPVTNTPTKRTNIVSDCGCTSTSLYYHQSFVFIHYSFTCRHYIILLL